MKGTLAILLGALLFAGAVGAQEKVKTEDPFDLSATQRRIQELGIPTASRVADLERQGTELFDKGDCVSALPVLENLGRQANWLANLISAGLQPFYGASYDERKSFRDTSKLAGHETQGNRYKGIRNKAMLLQAECQVKLGRADHGLSLLVNVLNLISIDETGLWERARKRLYEMVEVQ